MNELQLHYIKFSLEQVSIALKFKTRYTEETVGINYFPMNGKTRTQWSRHLFLSVRSTKDLFLHWKYMFEVSVRLRVGPLSLSPSSVALNRPWEKQMVARNPRGAKKRSKKPALRPHGSARPYFSSVFSLHYPRRTEISVGFKKTPLLPIIVDCYESVKDENSANRSTL